MIDHIFLIEEVDNKPAALEAALLSREWDTAISLMEQRLTGLETLASTPSSDPIIQGHLHLFAKRQSECESKIIKLLEESRTALGHELYDLMQGNKAAQLYKQNR